MNTLFKFFIRRYRITFLLIFASMLFGTISMFSLQQEADPEVEIPYAIVTTIYPGASPADIESLITREIEEKLDSLDDVEEITSTSSSGVSSVAVEFQTGADIILEDKIDDLKDKIEEVKNDLPDGAEDPVVTEISIDDFAIITFSLGGNGISEDQLSDAAEDVEDELENISGVSRVDVLGKRSKEIDILLDQEKLIGLNLSAGAIVQKIQTSHLDFPLGETFIDGVSISLRLEGEFEGAEDLKNLPLLTTENGTVKLGDIATVKEVREKETSRSYLSIAGAEPVSTMSLQIYKKTGANIIDIADNAKETIAKMKENGEIPRGLKIEISNDNSQFIRDDLDRLITNGIGTIFIVFALIWIALGFKEAIIAGFSIPIVFLLTFTTIQAQGNTLNSLSLFSLVLSLGLIVDTTIVITEGIFDNLRLKKMSSGDAAYNSVKTFWRPITSGTLTTVSAFVPMLLVSGILGQFMSVIPLTIAPTLLWSLFVALFFVPSVATKIFKNAKFHKFEEQKTTKLLKAKLRTVLHYLMHHKKIRRRLITSVIAIFLVALSLPISGLLPVEMFPSYNADYFNIELEMPPGTNMDRTEAEAQPVIKMLRENENVENFLFAVGAGALGMTSGLDTGGSSSSSNEASFTVNLPKAKERDLTSYEIANQVREQIETIATAGKFSVEELQAGPPSGKPIEVRVFGEDLGKMEIVAKKIKKNMSEIDGVIEIKDDISVSAGEFVFRLKREQLDFYNLSASSVAMELRTAIFGTDATEIARGDDDLDVRVAIDWGNVDKKPETIQDIENIILITPAGERITVQDVADISLEQAFATINHKDKKKIVLIQADVASGENVAQKTQEVQKMIEQDISLPSDMKIVIGGSTEDIAESFSDLFRSMGVAVVLIAFILILQFQSFVQPFIIIFTVPLALIGVLFGFFFIGWPISFPTFIGIVSLVGIVINDAIVLIERVKENIASGKKFEESIIDGAVSRMKPIFLTSVTTICGILPLALSDETWGGLGYAIVFGLMFSTFLTLIVVPTLFYIVEYKYHQRRLKQQKIEAEAERAKMAEHYTDRDY